MIIWQDGSRNIKGNLLSSFVKWIHLSPILSSRIKKPPLSELPNVDVLVSRKLFLEEVIYYFDLMQEKESGVRFVKISEQGQKHNKKHRSHIMVGLADLPSFSNILNQGKYKEAIDDSETYGTLGESKVFKDKRYDFIVWGRGPYSNLVHIEIKETGRTYNNLVKNRDPSFDSYGVFRIVISTKNLQGFLNELDELIFNANEM